MPAGHAKAHGEIVFEQVGAAGGPYAGRAVGDATELDHLFEQAPLVGAQQGEVVGHQGHAPETPTAWAHARTRSGVRSVSLVRSIRQSGSFSHSRRCMKLRRECAAPGRPGRRGSLLVAWQQVGGGRRAPRRGDVGPDAHPVHQADHRPEGQPQPRMNMSSPAPRRIASVAESHPLGGVAHGSANRPWIPGANVKSSFRYRYPTSTRWRAVCSSYSWTSAFVVSSPQHGTAPLGVEHGHQGVVGVGLVGAQGGMVGPGGLGVGGGDERRQPEPGVMPACVDGGRAPATPDGKDSLVTSQSPMAA